MLVREPDALVAHVRFDEGSVETGTMARPFRHRQTKGAETDTPDLTSTAPHSYSTAILAITTADRDPPYELSLAHCEIGGTEKIGCGRGTTEMGEPAVGWTRSRLTRLGHLHSS